MADVTLIEIDRAVAQAVAEDNASFEARYGASLGEHADLVREVVQQTLALLAAAPREPPWGGYLAVDEGGRQVVGTCAFTTGLWDDGSVEIAYFPFPPFEGRGFATAMARELLTIALLSPPTLCRNEMPGRACWRRWGCVSSAKRTILKMGESGAGATKSGVLN